MISRLRALCSVADPPCLHFGTRGSIAFLLLGCLLIVAWQAEFIKAGQLTPSSYLRTLDQANWKTLPHQLDRTYGRRTGKGLYARRIQKYFYFVYYTGKFPITTPRAANRLNWHRRSAWRALRLPDPAAAGEAARPYLHRSLNRSPSLIMEDYALLRTGDLGKVFLLYPDAWISGTPRGATVRWFNRLLGVASLLSLFVSFSLLNHRLFGTALVVVLGSNPFQLVELFTRNNIFGYPIAVASLVLALHAPLILGRWRHASVYALPLVTGAFLATFREVRAEPALVILSAGATYLLASGSWWRRVALVALLVLSAATTSAAWGHYWQAKFDEAYEIVSAVRDGETFDGDWNAHHSLWHSIWAGLGDFGQDRGYRWYDRAVYRYGIPKVNERFGRDYRYEKGRLLENYYTAARKHRIKPETLEEYAIVLREKVLGDIRADPLWYASVVAKRVDRLFSQPTPIRLGFGAHYFDVPFSAWLFIPALGWIAFLRRWDQFMLLGFYGSTSLTTIAVYSGDTMPYNSAFHQVLFAAFVCWGAHGARVLLVVLRKGAASW